MSTLTYNKTEAIRLKLDIPEETKAYLSRVYNFMRDGMTIMDDLFRGGRISKYGGYNFLFKYGNIGFKNLLEKAYDCQPKSLLILLKYSDKFSFNKEYINNMMIKINKIFPNINNYNDLKNNKLFNNKNIYSKDNTINNLCNICYSYESNIIFLPCYHKCCISCSIKISNCHICREKIEERKYIY